MSEHTSETGDASEKPVRTRSFQKWRPRSVLSPEQTRRQSDVLRCAHQNLPRDTMVAFLNSYNQQLDGVPLQLALESDEGLRGVEKLLLDPNGRKEPEASVAVAK